MTAPHLPPGLQGHADTLQGWRRAWAEIVFLWRPSDAFLQQKLRDMRAFTVLAFLASGPFSVALRLSDMLVDPQGASASAWLNWVYFIPTLLAVVIWRSERHRSLAWLCSLVLLLLPLTHLLILTLLTDGMVYGLAGFLYFQLVALVFLQCFSLRWNLFYAVATAALPHIAAWLGLAPQFPHLLYAVLIWPTVVFTTLIQTGAELNYLRRYVSERQLEIASNTDPMTGVANRRHFEPRLADELSRARRHRQPLALLMLDIDHFKRVNDQYGHPAGDDVIRSLAQQCIAAARQIDVVARLGGEEFAILLPGANLDQAVQVAERLRALVGNVEVDGPDGQTIRYTVSVGAAQLSDADLDHQQLIARADAALYDAKYGGRNRVCAAA